MLIASPPTATSLTRLAPTLYGARHPSQRHAVRSRGALIDYKPGDADQERHPGRAAVGVRGTRVRRDALASEGTEAYIPAFDVTPADLAGATVTRLGFVRPGVDDLQAFVESPRVAGAV